MTPVRFRTLAAVLVAAAGLYLAYEVAGTLLLVFAGVLAAVILDAATLCLRRVLPLGRLMCLTIASVLLLVLLLAGVAWGGVSLVSQAQNLISQAGEQAGELREYAESLGIPLPFDEEGGGDLRSLLPDARSLFGHAQTAFGLTLGAVANVVIILFLGLFFAADPAGYRDGFVKLLPVGRRQRVAAVLTETGHALRWWMVGQLVTMALVAVSITLMLLAFGISNAVLLGLLAGLLNFVPYVGPILAGVPVFLAVLPEGLAMLAGVMAAFVVIESLEGYLVNPLIQKRAVYLPPAWSLAALVVFGALFGIIGVVLATPVLAVARILVLRLYVEDTLEEPYRVRSG